MATILVVDDVAANRDLLTTLLGYRGHRLLEAADGAGALATARVERPDLVIADILMPTMDGFEFVRRLRSEPDVAHTPVVFYTANYHLEQARALAASCGVRHVLTKPAEPEEIFRIVEEALRAPVRAPEAVPPDIFDSEHVRVLTDQLAEKVRELETANHRLQHLNELGVQLGSEQDPLRLLERYLVSGRELLGARAAAVGMLNGGETLRHFLTCGIDDEIRAAVAEAGTGSGILSEVIRMRQAHRSVAGDGELAALLPNRYSPRNSLLVVPIASPKAVYGWFWFEDRLGANAFTLEDEQLAMSLGAQLAVAWENAARMAALAESEAKARSILSALTEGVVLLNANGEVESVNDAVHRVLGRSLQELTDPALDPRWRLVRADGTPFPVEEQPAIAALRTGQGVRDVEMGVPCSDGTLAWISVNAEVVRSPSGDVHGAVASFRDVTERRRMEHALRQAEALYRTLFEQAPVGVVLIDPTTLRPVEFNSVAHVQLGYSRDEFAQLRIGDYEAVETPEATRQRAERLLREGQYEFETCHRTKQGELRQVAVSARRIELGGSQFVFAVFHDITERKRAEEALQESNSRLEEALKSLQQKTEQLQTMSQQLWQTAKLATMGELSASIAHELNNPLGTVTLRVEGLLEDLEGDEPHRRDLQVIEQEVERMAGLVANLLQFSRRSHQQISTIDVCEEIDNTLDLIQFHLRNRRIQVVRQYTPDLPRVQADRQQLRQVFLNLFTNASDAMPQGGTLTIRTATNGDVAIEIADTGSGIPPELLDRVKEPFFTTKPLGKGTGLGLAICQRIVQEHHGAFTLTSREGQGTTARITLPKKTGSNGIHGGPSPRVATEGRKKGCQ